MTETESRYLNILYENCRADFDFTKKRVVVGDYRGYDGFLSEKKVKIRSKDIVFDKYSAEYYNLYRDATFYQSTIILYGEDYGITNVFDVLIIVHPYWSIGNRGIIYQPPYEHENTEIIKRQIISNYAKLF